MKKENKNCLKLAIQKVGRLTEETLNFLRSSGLKFESYQTKLFSRCLNFPLEILYVRDDDIANYVSEGVVDLGIIGQNLLYELRPELKKLLNLRYGFCSLIVAVPKEKDIRSINELRNLEIATSYPNSTRKFFQDRKIPIKIVKISGSVEVAPLLGVSQAVADLVSTGSTLVLNDLKVISKIYDSEAVLVVNKKSLENLEKKTLISNLLTRFKGVLSAGNYKYVMFNTDKETLSKLEKIIPVTQFSATSTVNNKNLLVQLVLKEDFLWEMSIKIKQLGISNMVILPIEKIVS